MIRYMNKTSFRIKSVLPIRGISQVKESKPLEQPEWKSSSPFSSIPGPGKISLMLNFMPGGKYHNISINDLQKKLRIEYGDLIKVPGGFGKNDVIFDFNPDDFEKIYREEGQWPIRRGLDTYEYYRTKHRPELFQGIGGLVSDQGELWQKTRTIANPILMKPRNTVLYVPKIDEIATDFINKKFLPLLDDKNETPSNFASEFNKWALESICFIALNSRIGVLDKDVDKNKEATKLIEYIRDFFSLVYKLDVEPSIWRYIKTPTFHKLMSTMDGINEIIMNKIDEATENLKDKPKDDSSEEGVFEKLVKIDKNIAMVMAYDLILAGVDTTSSAVISILFRLAKNPDKQAKLREELLSILPNKDTPLTADNMKNLPYLRACMKEGLRFMAPFSQNFRTTVRDTVLQGYQIPKDTDVMMGTDQLFMEDKYFPQASTFLPERWLKDTAQSSGCPSAKSAHPFVYLPFGFGPRMCIGRRFVEMEIEVLLSRIIRNFHVEWHYADLKYVSTTINVPTGDLKFRIREVEN